MITCWLIKFRLEFKIKGYLTLIFLKEFDLETCQKNNREYGMMKVDDKIEKTERGMKAWPGVPELTYCYWLGG